MTHKKKEHQPSRFYKWLIKRIFRDEGEAKLGDFIEIYSTFAEDKGQLQARIRFCWYLSRSIPEYLKDSLCMGATMIKNYIKIAWRNIQKQKSYSLINVFGFSLGLACFALIMLYVQHEFSFDKFHDNKDHIFRIINHYPGAVYMGTDYSANTNSSFAEDLLKQFPEIKYSTRVQKSSNGELAYEDLSFFENGLFVDHQFLKIFSFKLMKGNREEILADPYSIVITDPLAKKLFGNKDPVGEVVNFNQQYNLTVTGILEEVPDNSHLRFDYLISLSSTETSSGDDNWRNEYNVTYIEMYDGKDYKALENKLMDKNVWKHKFDDKIEYILQPLGTIHLHSAFNMEIAETSNIAYLYVLTAAAAIILLIACFNYINLFTARLSKRSKEIGIRKVVGATRYQLTTQFLLETVTLTFIASFIAIILLHAAFPHLENFMGKKIGLTLFDSFSVLFSVIIAVLILGILSGSYAAFFLSSSRANAVLRGKTVGISSGISLRKYLVIAQFGFSICIIVSTLIFSSQLNYILKKDVGYNKEQLLIIRIQDEGVKKNCQVFLNELSKDTRIRGLSASTCLPSYIHRRTAAKVIDSEGNIRSLTVYRGTVDYDFLSLFDIKLIAGRSFLEDRASDIKHAVLINEEVTRQLGWDNSIGKRIEMPGFKDGEVIGVMKDFHYQSLYNKIEPCIFYLNQKDVSYISARLSVNDINDTIGHIEELYKKFSISYPIDYFFLDDDFRNQYKSEQDLKTIFTYFTIFSFVISCLGLLGITAFMADMQRKEIGIRKVLGASSLNILYKLNTELIKWTATASIIAWPIAYFTMHRWLQNFAYRTRLNIWIFLLSGLTALVIALLAVSYQSIKAATANPVDSLRYE
jgi:putative ABC transport system permease protein